ncbi:hypothetical protein FOS14_13965 [Skermania sp. ID1734]|uniref:DUF5615 family PIN-like protein n=1 Tax=Skermania sp. ID1734 TaxID=2597516 RepID=UPI001180D703|nr:DUF5615 family PIN-like protein [Skermania sp. ID1734]TSD98097.1 hypothetical protein FOS14_13965 [Skermania sp. ID1734]
MKLLLDEMNPRALAEALGQIGIDAVTVADLRISGAPDSEVFAAARADKRAVLTENVADFIRLAAELLTAGGHHSRLVIALSSRFSRRPAGIGPLTTAVAALVAEDLNDRVVYLQRCHDRP